MKRLIYSALVLFTALLSVSSCEDVPAPFNTDFDNNGGGDTPAVVEPAGEGTVSSPYNVARTLEIIKGSTFTTDKVYVKGIITQIDELSTSYGNATYYIADAANSTTSFEIFRGYGLDGAKFSQGDEIKVGDVVVVYGTLTSYNGTPEMAQGSQIYSLNGKGGSGGGTSTGDMGTEAKPFDVTSALTAGQKTGVYVQGYIVGFASGKDLSTDSKFSATDAVATNVLIAASATETDVKKCMPVQLPLGDVRTGINLKDNAGNLGKQVTLYGDLANYFNVQGVKNTTYAKLGSKEYGTKPGNGGSSETTLLTFDFKKDGKGNWTITDVKKDNALSAVWTADTKYGMKATGYVSATQTNYDTDSWLISPEIDMSGAKSLVVSQAANFFANGVEAECSVLLSTDYTSGDPSKATWTKLTFDTWPTNWTYINSTASLGAMAGKKNVKIAFRYTSTAAKAGTWEVGSLSLK